MAVSTGPRKAAAHGERTIAGDASTGNPLAVTWHLREVRLLDSAFRRRARETQLPGFELDLAPPRPDHRARDEAAVLRLALHHALREWEVDAQIVAADRCATPAEEQQVWDRLERVRRVLEARDQAERERALAELGP